MSDSSGFWVEFLRSEAALAIYFSEYDPVLVVAEGTVSSFVLEVVWNNPCMITTFF